ncbi:MAG: hypothetical protein AAF298_03035 [Cyanobacteria bacterium P01_A01_bin.40]
MSQSIIELVDDLPTDNITVKVLKTISTFTPGKWENLVGFDNTITAVTGATTSQDIAKIRERALSLYEDKKQGYQTAIWLYRTVDHTDQAIAAAAIADKIGDTFRFIPFLEKITPKADSIQSVDLRIKLVAELIVFCKLNGLTLDPARFVGALRENYQDEALLRMASLVCIDGILPLGVNFVSKIKQDLESKDNLRTNPAYEAVGELIPSENKAEFIDQSFSTTADWMNSFSQKLGITPETLSTKLGGFIELADGKLDYLAAFLDGSTNFFEHTGIQTVARRLITEAASSI